MRAVFMGTPDFAVPSLRALVDCGFDVAAVFTQPDKKVGRKQLVTPCAVKLCAEQNGLRIYQPDSLKNSDAADIIESIAPDVIVVAAYGKILSRRILDIPRFGCINVHASLLPKYRGAAPIQHAVLNGDKETGISIMQMDEGIDTGDIIYTVKTAVGDDETSEELFERLAVIGAEALIKALKMVESGTAKPQKQQGEAVYASMIDRSYCPIDWNRPAVEVHNRIRGLQSWPCAETLICGKRVKIYKSSLCSRKGGAAGEVMESGSELVVSCGDGRCVSLLILQPDGKKKMEAGAYLAGNRISPGTILGR